MSAEDIHMSIYDIAVKNQKGELTNLLPFQGQVLLIVNTATGCGFTPQYEGLQKLYDTYKERGFAVLDFPCNQFGNQAPGSEKDINQFCSLNYNTTFPRFAKVDVNGENTAPLFVFLKKAKKTLLGSSIKWNFEKFLVDQKGSVIKRYPSTIKPEAIEKDIKALLG